VVTEPAEPGEDPDGFGQAGDSNDEHRRTRAMLSLFTDLFCQEKFNRGHPFNFEKAPEPL
jgi:hypothetical protein